MVSKIIAEAAESNEMRCLIYHVASFVVNVLVSSLLQDINLKKNCVRDMKHEISNVGTLHCSVESTVLNNRLVLLIFMQGNL